MEGLLSALAQAGVFLAPKPWDDWELFGEQVVRGVAAGSAYALLALAIVFVFQSSGLLNFAQGEWGMFTTFVAWSLIVAGLPEPAALVAAVILGASIAAVMFRTLVERVPEALPLSRAAITIALFLMFNSAAVWVWGRGQLPKFFPSIFGLAPIHLGPIVLGRHDLGTFLTSITVMVLLALFFTRTKLGLAMRAAATNPNASRLMGINVERMLTLGWAIGGALGSLAAALIAPATGLSTTFMFSVLILAFAGATVGGILSPQGAVLGSIMIGVGENLLGVYTPGWLGSEMRLALIMMLILVVLLVRPYGLLGHQQGERA